MIAQFTGNKTMASLHSQAGTHMLRRLDRCSTIRMYPKLLTVNFDVTKS